MRYEVSHSAAFRGVRCAVCARGKGGYYTAPSSSIMHVFNIKKNRPRILPVPVSRSRRVLLRLYLTVFLVLLWYRMRHKRDREPYRHRLALPPLWSLSLIRIRPPARPAPGPEYVHTPSPGHPLYVCRMYVCRIRIPTVHRIYHQYNQY